MFRPVRTLLALLLLFCPEVAAQQLKGEVQAVYDLLKRVLPTAESHFSLRIASAYQSQSGSSCYSMEDMPDGRVLIEATSASELSFAVGDYLREFCNMTIGWPRGGSINVFIPKKWPRVGSRRVRSRAQPWSYFMNVCTHSYSLVWYSWEQWEAFIDWMALVGINLVLAMTGQEEIQYKVFRKFGLSDMQIRAWFNGPALLAWSRGQNEYGSKIAGPLPRSWMKAQWSLQRKILGRYRSLGIVGQLPGFQGNVPIALKDILKDTNMTDNKLGTAWMDSLDPMFGKIADEWMRTLIEDFGTDHWYQLDGYFNGGTAPWMQKGGRTDASSNSELSNITPDPTWYRRGVAAYTGLNRTDPKAIWSFQGWSFVDWKTAEQASHLKGFIDATPVGKFVVIDMSTNGEGQWKQWNNAGFWGARFIWTTLHDFGGTDGMKGNLSQVNEIPFQAMEGEHQTSVWGTGFTPEGIDQNPVYYEFVLESNWRTARITDITEHIVARSHRRYGLQSTSELVSDAWALLVDSAYAEDVGVQDGSGVPHLPGSVSKFESDRFTPKESLCKTFRAWERMVSAAVDERSPVDHRLHTFRYDLVNLGREVMAQLSTPASMNFSDALKEQSLDGARISSTGKLYVDILVDIDLLVGTDSAFLLGPWIEMARAWGKSSDDCAGNSVGITRCEDFYEWNARVQLTTWNPTLEKAKAIPSGPIDYASKHWNGLIRDYYARRAALLMERALLDAAAARPLDVKATEEIKAQLAYNWTTSTARYPTEIQGDAAEISQAMLLKYRLYFSSCGEYTSLSPKILFT